MYELRDYQKEAVEAILANKDSKTNDIISVATGGGKSLIIANAAYRLDQAVLILSPSREITEQNRDKMVSYVGEGDVGIYSASFKSKDIRKFTFATIQSIYKYPEKFQDFKYIFIDECHATTEENKLGSMFISFISKLDAKIFGFTATPYRVFRKTLPKNPKEEIIITQQEIKMITDIKYIWDDIIYCTNYSDLLEKGYLVPMRAIYDFTAPGAKMYLGKYLGLGNDKLEKFLANIHRAKRNVLVFNHNLKQAEEFAELTKDSAIVAGSTKTEDRIEILRKYKEDELKVLYNYEALLTGFDNSNIGAIILFRSFSSLGQYVQALGRGTRLHEWKKECIVIDFRGNIQDHGMPQDIVVKKIDGKWGVYNRDRKLNDVMKQSIFRSPKKKKKLGRP